MQLRKSRSDLTIAKLSVLWQNCGKISFQLVQVFRWCKIFSVRFTVRSVKKTAMVLLFLVSSKVGDLKIFGKLSMSEDEGLKLLVKSIQVFSGGRWLSWLDAVMAVKRSSCIRILVNGCQCAGIVYALTISKICWSTEKTKKRRIIDSNYICLIMFDLCCVIQKKNQEIIDDNWKTKKSNNTWYIPWSCHVRCRGVMQVGTSFAPHRTSAIISFWGVTRQTTKLGGACTKGMCGRFWWLNVAKYFL